MIIIWKIKKILLEIRDTFLCNKYNINFSVSKQFIACS